jgi:uncharacterized protein YndB with AHSA1/START domain
MSTDSAAIPPADTASVHVDASPEQVWDMVADVTRMGEWSPETFRCRWTGSVRRPEPGAKFVGFNKQGWLRWATRCVVEEAERGKVFAWRVRDNNTRWEYRMEPDGDGTRLTESRQLPAERPFLSKYAIKLFLGGTETHNARMQDSIQKTLDRIKAKAQA